MKIADYMQGRDNNYNLLRVIAAFYIAYYHCYFMVLGPDFSEAAHPLLYLSSQFVLNFFFIISGFLIAQSFEKRRDIVSYIAARVLRLVPGVFVLSLIVCFILGPLVTEASMAVYFSSLKTLLYVPVTTALYPDATLPGVFASNPNPYEIDAALWTLRYEVVCYIGLALLGLMGLLQRARLMSALIALILLVYLLISFVTSLREIAAINHLTHFGMSFFTGVVFYLYRSKIALNVPIMVMFAGLAVVAYWLLGMKAELLLIIATAYVSFWLAYVPTGAVRRYNKLGDYSYGVYIYHYPVQQLLMFLHQGFSVTGLYLAMLPLVIVFAIASWIFVERPAMSLLPQISSMIKGRLAGGVRLA